MRIYEKSGWKKAMFGFLCHVQKTSSDYSKRWNLIEGFTKSNIKKIHNADTGEKEDLILICVVLNEIERISIFLEHYRKLGIRRFAIIDNGSVDGTVQYLKMQRDVELFQTKDAFESRIKMGWINRIISYYGKKNWYLVVDADELLVWRGMEEFDIQKAIMRLKKKRMLRARALMVDLYPKDAGSEKKNFDEVFSKCKYFDSDTYYYKKADEVYLLCGGPRKRVLGVEVWLTKYPLFKLNQYEILSNPHTIFPYQNKRTPCFFALLHFKFLSRNDKRKMRIYARKGNYAGGSAEYKAYMEKAKELKGEFCFYHKTSVEYISSKSLEEIKEIQKF